MGNKQWKVGAEEVNLVCYKCGTACGDLEWASHLFHDDPGRKTYIFGHDSKTKETFEISAGFSVGVGGVGAGTKTTIEKGQHLVKMFRKDGEAHICAKCFWEKDNTLFKSILATLKGRSYVINISELKLVSPEGMGDFPG